MLQSGNETVFAAMAEDIVSLTLPTYVAGAWPSSQEKTNVEARLVA